MFENNLSDPNGWSLGKINNLREVFGELIFLYPIYNAYLSMVSLNKIDEFQLYNIHKNSLSKFLKGRVKKNKENSDNHLGGVNYLFLFFLGSQCPKNHF